MADRIGSQLGNYRLLRLIGQGGFAEVYLGEHIYLDTLAAIKVMHTQLSDEEREKFRIEARTVARLAHPHIIRVLEFGIEGATPFLVIDYAPSGTLRKRHPKGSVLPLDTVASYVRQVAEALQHAHERNIIHRDVKPENMLIGRNNEILLSDFGIALVSQGTRYMSTEGIQDLAGTIAYMAPEQMQSRAIPASDQYALAVVAYEWLGGARPFEGTFTEVAVKHTLTPPPSLREKVHAIPEVVEAVIMKALAKDPHQRYPSVLAFAEALEQASCDAVPGYLSLGGHKARPHLRGKRGLGDVHVLAPSLEAASHFPRVLPETTPDETVPLPDELMTVQGESPKRISRRAALAGVGTLGLVVLGGAGLFTLYARNRRAVPPSSPTMNVRSTTVLTFAQHTDRLWTVDCSPDGQYCASGGADALVRVWQTRDGAPLIAYDGHSDSVYAVSWSPDGKRIASCGYDGTVQVWDALTGYYPLHYHGHQGFVWSLAWSPDGQYIASGGADTTVQIWDTKTREVRTHFKRHTGLIFHLRWSPDGKRIASVSADGTVQIWNPITGALLSTFRPFNTLGRSLSWSPDGERLAVACDNKTVWIFDASNGDHPYTYYGHSDFVYTVAWSPDGRLLASAGDDRTIQVWSAQPGSDTLTLEGHRDAVRSVVWLPDSSRVISASWDKTVRIWRVR
uniref:Protein kinase domain-containing protein n=1 Tax=Thermosporothrix sp. COM3 TaxID=2490863 RepID=A0A455SUB0_9CHLR|nr:hypothetical protein KTC_54920 [Thermosporothrix sp. COM3]